MRTSVFAVLSLLIAIAGVVHAQVPPPYFTTSNNAGTEFYLSFLPSMSTEGKTGDACLYIISPVETTVTIEVEAAGWSRTRQTKPYAVLEVTIPSAIAQPYYREVHDNVPPEQIYNKRAVHITAKDPIIVYGLSRQHTAREGFTALPVASWGKHYIVGSFAGTENNNVTPRQYMPAEAAIVAAFDNTKVVFTLGGNPITKTAGGLTPGKSISIGLHKGDVFLLSTLGNGADLAGSTIEASSPVGVLSGGYYSHIPTHAVPGNHTVGMELPAHTWGREFAVTHIFGQQENSLVIAVAKEPNTKIYLDGRHIYTIQTAGGTEGTGFMSRRISDGVPQSFTLTSDKPISVMQFNTTPDGGHADLPVSRPFQLVLTPMEQFRNSIIFYMPDIGGNTDLKHHYVNVVFELDTAGNMPAGLEFREYAGSGELWKSVGDQYGTSFEKLKAVGGRQYGVKTLPLPYAGVYGIRSPYACAAYIYGVSDSAAYAMPAGVHLADLTKNDTLAPEISFSQECDGSVLDGSVFDPGSAEQRSNLSKVLMIESASRNYKFEVSPFKPGEASTATWTLTVIDDTDAAIALLECVDRAGNTSLKTISSGRPTIRIQNGGIDFGRARVGTSVERTIVLRSMNSVAGTIESLHFSPVGEFAVVSAPALPFVLQPGEQFEVVVRYTPAHATTPEGAHESRLTAFTTCHEIIAGTIKGQGIAPGIAVADRDLGVRAIGEESCMSLYVSNPGSDTLMITAITGAQPPFSIQNLQPALPVRLAPGEEVEFSSFCFTPSQEGVFATTITFSSDAVAAGSDSLCILQGEGRISTDVVSTGDEIQEIVLYPNPAAGFVQLRYTLPVSGIVRAELFTATGRLVRTLYGEFQSAGLHTVEMSTIGLAAGVYLCRLTTPEGTTSHAITIGE